MYDFITVGPASSFLYDLKNSVTLMLKAVHYSETSENLTAKRYTNPK